MTEPNNQLAVLIDQVGRLTEGLTEFRADMADIKERVREQLVVAQAQAENINRLAETTDRQTILSERLVATVERQAATVERQAVMLEALLGRQV
ncbi:hypothetical protein GS597_07980 [Synechococcales cyanobacterium C]|uniref:Uncharacterized protein n=1 Tax=Petrachloros mirabilis ULC683 TaxID=2781853 RepID=A0A8K1ZWI4_9CYAN|nr:hypothetical protein [Petrachloros mirabilis]NCJ06449.1 hypothetical protein [Petrachloros mirabilis ULC683]